MAIDALVFLPLLALLYARFGTETTEVWTSNTGRAYIEHTYRLEGEPVLAFLGAWLVYYLLMEVRFGATLGKMATRLRVVMADGSPITLQAALVRTVLRIVDGLLFYLVGAVFAWNSPLRNDWATGWHRRWCSTRFPRQLTIPSRSTGRGPSPERSRGSAFRLRGRGASRRRAGVRRPDPEVHDPGRSLLRAVVPDITGDRWREEGGIPVLQGEGRIRLHALRGGRRRRAALGQPRDRHRGLDLEGQRPGGHVDEDRRLILRIEGEARPRREGNAPEIEDGRARGQHLERARRHRPDLDRFSGRRRGILCPGPHLGANHRHRDHGQRDEQHHETPQAHVRLLSLLR
ncbi:MAG: RDD family protein [Thermomicrobiales bacterium]|nr:RDD family protein [Thermomicrobiales bacterium]